jgi:hypothetical protein
MLRMVSRAAMLAIPSGVVVATFAGCFRAARAATRRRRGIPRGVLFPGRRVGHERDHAAAHDGVLDDEEMPAWGWGHVARRAAGGGKADSHQAPAGRAWRASAGGG